MELWDRIWYLLLIVSPILARPDFVSYANQLREAKTTSLTNPLNLVDLNELQDITSLEFLAEYTKNGTPSIIQTLEDVQTYTKMIFEPLCPESVLQFSGRKDVKFILYNKKYPGGVDISKNMGKDMLIPNTPIKFVIHGFLDGGNSEMCQTVKNAYMERAEDYNVIIVDWSKGSGTWLSNYFVCLITSKVVPLVGQAVSEFVLDLVNQQQVNILYVNLIGHSLGAQISGIAGKHLINNGHKLPVIVGLDPALPEFKDVDISQRLCPTDAEYVEVIHTNCGELGFRTPIGTADFYPNFSKFWERMPGCFTASCSHSMSFKYFAESIKSPFSFLAQKCSDYNALEKESCPFQGAAYMGGNDVGFGKSAGIFFLETNKDHPYGKSIE